MGTIFEITAAGVYTTLYSFQGEDGAYPSGGFLLASGGHFYGTTSSGGPYNTATVYRLNIVRNHVQFTAAAHTVKESAASVSLAVSRAGDGMGAVSVHYATADGTAHAGKDSRATSGTLSWADGDVSPKTVVVSLIAPAMYNDGSRAFAVNLSAPTGGLALAAPSAAIVTILNELTLTITSPSTAYAQSGEPFSYQITASPNPSHYGVDGLPDGLSVDPETGVISGTHVGGGSVSMTLHAYNGGRSASAPLALYVDEAGIPFITSALTATAVQGSPFTYQITANGNPTRFGVSGLPPGFSVNTRTGVLSGTPQGAGEVTLYLNAYNAAGVGSDLLTLTVQPRGTPLITSAPTASGATNAAFSYRIAASGEPTSFGVQGLPPGLSADAATGIIAATPKGGGTYRLTLIAYNTTGRGSATLTLTIEGVPVILGANTAAGVVNQAFSYQILASGSPTRYEVQGLPAGVSVDTETGLLAGTPQAAGTVRLTLDAYNAIGKGSATLTLTITQ